MVRTHRTVFALAALLTGCVADTAGLEALAGLDVAPAEIRFGTLGADCGPFEQPVTVRNDGDATVVIRSVALEVGEVFEVVAVPAELPFELGPRTELEVLVRFSGGPTDGDYEDRLVVDGTLAGAPFTEFVVIRGRVSQDGRREDRFQQGQVSDADILFVIDNSCSMVHEQDQLTRNFGSFIQIADSGLLNYQIGVTTTDVSAGDDSEIGRLVPTDGPAADRLVTRASLPSALDAFVRIARVGIEGSGDERGLAAARLAVSEALLAGPNFGLLRDNALLSVIIISDEFDQSPEEDVGVYADALVAAKGGDPSRVSVSAVVGPPGGCDSPGGGRAFPAPRYTEMARRLNGAIESVCAGDWSEVMRRLSSTAFGLRARFALSERPEDPDSLSVVVDGQPAPPRDDLGRDRWWYDPISNSVVFASRSVPGPGASIVIGYGTGCDGVE